MEELYWKDVKDANATHYMTLWHEDFLGWPSFTPHPIGKDGIADSTAGWFAGFVSYESVEKSVRVAGDIGITQYAVTITRSASDGKLATNITRITHTWLKTKNTWQIIGGMSAVISSSALPAPSPAAPPSAPDAPASPLTAASILANIPAATRSAAATSASKATACCVFCSAKPGYVEPVSIPFFLLARCVILRFRFFFNFQLLTLQPLLFSANLCELYAPALTFSCFLIADIGPLVTLSRLLHCEL